ncbi:MAG: acyl-CoA dehydrogenase family protein [Candidatus Electryonea clarkiae]|nr:acyl-CoA dehydrogenase family protein [Candidatus Electryonea clarkiae]MDP8286827.1 acyl-CoA dehydrogenase family protein [Candidatus Electryonea clarkiae]
MDFRLTEEQEMLRQTARDFSEKELRAGVAERDEKEIFPGEYIEQLSELGFMGMVVSEENGGTGFDTVGYVVALEEMARIDPSVEIIVSVHNSLHIYPLEKFGSDYIKKECLSKMVTGEWLGAFALTEPGSGSDAGAMKTTAAKSGNEWILNGTKNFITSGSNCDAYVLVAVTDKDKGAKGSTAFWIPRETPGLIVGKHENKMGIRSTDTVSISLEDARIPEEYIIGKPGDGFKIMLTALDSGRLGVAAQGLGIAQAALEESLSYSQERFQFGKPIAAFQGIQNKVADMQIKISQARWSLYHAAWMKDQGERYSKEAAIAKVACSEAAMWCANQAVQIFGGYGYCKDYPVERMLRDAKITEIYEGTNEIQRVVISRALYGR